MNIAKIARKIQAQNHQFSGKLSGGLPKVSRRFIEEMVYGIQARGSVRLSEIARSLNEGITLRKTINRLSQQLKRPGLVEQIEDALIAEEQDKRIHVADCRCIRHHQALCKEDGVFGSGERWE